MASESEQEPVPQAAATGKKPPLVCAPCWICLEDGPDEAGEPLVRDCACRGETSAGYHLSCIIKYATAKTDQVLSNANMLDICKGDFIKDWRDCPNCCQPYGKRICMLMGQALVQFTEDRNLPKTHCVWFEARVFYSNTLIYSSQSKEEFKVARDLIEFLLSLVEEECATLAAEWWGDEAKGQLLKEIQTGKLLLMLGRAHKVVGAMLKSQNFDQSAYDLNRKSLVYFESALRNFQVARNRGNRLDHEIQKAEDFIKNMKFELGLISVDQRIEDYRKELKNLENNGADGFDIMTCKVCLSEALVEKDPPDFFEAIKLHGEQLTWLERAFGSDHDIVLGSKERFVVLKREYRDYLKTLNSS